jgi:predicted hydrocarbon binding protein
MAQFERSGIVEYLEDVSKTDEHHFRVYEGADCWGLQGIGVRVASHLPPLFAGSYRGLERVDRGWNAVETKCIGVGDPYCEFKVVPGGTAELRASLEKDPAAVGRIHERLMERLVGFLLHGSPLVERPRLGSDVQLHAVWHAMGSAMGGERYRMAQRMGGAKSGKEVGERLLAAGLGEDEAIKRVIDFLQHCKVGRVTTRPGPSALALSTSLETGGKGSGQAVNETIMIEGNCESLSMVSFLSKTQGPSCFFTTGFLNGLFSAVRNQHVREVKCMAAGDAYCEWEVV